MPILEFTAPPLPHYIAGGYDVLPKGFKHLNRRDIGVFDLLVVSFGCLYVGEEERRYEVSAGHALILRPDRHHYGYEGCKEQTGAYWLHFGTEGAWRATDNPSIEPPSESRVRNAFTVHTFSMMLPQFVRLTQPSMLYEKLDQLIGLERDSHHNWARWKHQLIFQQVLELLNASLDLHTVLPGANVAERAASYIRMHYSEDITIGSLAEALNFHPVYIARCMQKELGCSPIEYLTRYRLEQAKLYLLQTDLPIHRVAEQVGFTQPSYFSTCFAKYEGLSPRDYRKRFRIRP
ncbi:helix-turn-helix transcriptional regulator [Paenibacillus thermoaerophilus]|uniref:Helix-turn-helix transcriptional regulator n=1 Tax=Paenibacillus thermoaerophilus TaxID=1215385 RepID=A0ABW2V2J8_9BACL|nr:AraC family transcriptional regulator [Paenibacillus thermoaerophilus]TMV10445.1 helix-turn-helix transcriptional regulator [Paenibacillus thermoaerophilus]